MPKLEREEARSFSKLERQKLQRLYRQSGAAYGSVRNLVKASNLSVSKVRPYLHSKLSYTKFTLATRKFKRMKVFARFKIEHWCMDLAYVDKQAKDNNGVKYLLVRQYLFDWTVDAKKNENKRFQGKILLIYHYDYKKQSTQKTWVDKGTEFGGEPKKLCKPEGFQIYSTMNKTKAAFAESTIRSLKNTIYRYMEDNGWKYFNKLAQFVTILISRKNCSIDLIPKNVKNSDFLSFL